jgi:1-deoxy-D-xylulose-5-phosphate reductoisomerase
MQHVTPEDALKHPNWSMGRKISIDSATMMNKGLELIEAKWLYGLAIHQIDILVHPESVVHSMVEYQDGSVIAQLGIPDMSIPISYALSYPRHAKNTLPPLNLCQIGTLSFEKPDSKRFRCLELAHEAAKIGNSMPTVMNGANEIGVAFFLREKIGFLDIPVVVEKTMEAHQAFPVESIEAVTEADRWARETALSFVSAHP